MSSRLVPEAELWQRLSSQKACRLPTVHHLPSRRGSRGICRASDSGSYETYLELSNLKVLRADAKYMLAMKCLAMRLGEGYQDERDVRYIETYDAALATIPMYYDKFPETAHAVLRGILESEER